MRSGIRNLDKGLKALEAYKKRYRKSTYDAARELIIEISKATVMLTRVDTGRLVQGWQYSVNSPSLYEPKKEDHTEKIPEGAKEAYKRARAETLANEINEFKVARVLRVDKFFLVNNVDYVIHIENGTPTIPARMMLKRGIEAGLSAFRIKLRES